MKITLMNEFVIKEDYIIEHPLKENINYIITIRFGDIIFRESRHVRMVSKEYLINCISETRRQLINLIFEDISKLDMTNILVDNIILNHTNKLNEYFKNH